MLTREQQRDLRLALDAMREGQLTSADARQLNQLLHASSQARDLYLEHLLLAADLRWLLDHVEQGAQPTDAAPPAGTTAGLTADAGRAAILPIAPPPIPSSPSAAPLLARRARRATILRPYFRLGVASLLIVGVFWTFWAYVLRLGLDDATQRPHDRYVAKLLSAEGCQWKRRAESPRLGNEFAEQSWLELETGAVELEFNGGARVLLEAPVEFEIRSSGSGFLKLGKLLASVPQQATGFTVATPTSRVVDLGTEFGLVVSEDGSSDTAVKTGKVEVFPISGPNATQFKPHHLVSGQGLRIRAGQADVTPLMEADVKRVQSSHVARANSGVWTEDYRVLVWYRLGEDDPSAAAAGDNHNPPSSLANPTAYCQKTLQIVGPAEFTADAAPGVSRRALQLDPAQGGTYARVTGIPRVNDYWFLEAWVQPAATDKRATIASFGSDQTGFGLYLVQGQWVAVFNGAFWFKSGIQAQVGQWTHLALVRQAGRTCFYVDGVQTDPVTDAPLKTPDETLLVGGFFNEETKIVKETFPGTIDEVRIVQLTSPFDINMLLLNRSKP